MVRHPRLPAALASLALALSGTVGAWEPPSTCAAEHTPATAPAPGFASRQAPVESRGAGGDAAGLITLLETKLTAFDGAESDCFGQAVAVDGDTALVSARLDDVGANLDQGSAYVFVRAGGTWALQAQLTAPDGSAGDEFGHAVALSGDTALVGAPGAENGGMVDQGAAYVFVRVAGAWSLQARLGAPDGAAGDGFGYAVALSADTALVGASYAEEGGNVDQGAAHVFVRAGEAWEHQARLVDAEGAAGDRFGCAVAIEGDAVLIGAKWRDVGTSADQGAAFLFRRSGAAWSHEATLTADDGGAQDQLGSAVALSGDLALAGASWADVGGNTDQGAAYAFQRSGATWVQAAKFFADDGGPYDCFGRSVALAGDTALLGAPFADIGDTGDQGAAYLFRLGAEGWARSLRLSASDGYSNTWFGGSVSLAGAAALVSASFTQVGANPQQGAVYAYDGLVFDLAAGAATSSAAPPPGGTVHLTAAVANLSAFTAANVTVSAPLPTGLTLIADSASAGTYAPDGTWSVGPLGPYAAATLSIQAAVEPTAAGTSLVFKVAVPGADAEPDNNVAATTLRVPYHTLVLTSDGAQDGWVLESSETSGKGGSVGTDGAKLLLGDDGADRQFRSVLSFDTAALPDNAVLASATLQLKSAGVTGTNPFTTHGTLGIALASGAFSGSVTLQPTDFQAPATRPAAGTIGPKASAGWYQGALAASALPFVNRSGITQLRLAFARDDNDDRGADLLALVSGDAAAASRPRLVLRYALP